MKSESERRRKIADDTRRQTACVIDMSSRDFEEKGRTIWFGEPVLRFQKPR